MSKHLFYYCVSYLLCYVSLIIIFSRNVFSWDFFFFLDTRPLFAVHHVHTEQMSLLHSLLHVLNSSLSCSPANRSSEELCRHPSALLMRGVYGSTISCEIDALINAIRPICLQCLPSLQKWANREIHNQRMNWLERKYFGDYLGYLFGLCDNNERKTGFPKRKQASSKTLSNQLHSQSQKKRLD